MQECRICRYAWKQINQQIISSPLEGDNASLGGIWDGFSPPAVLIVSAVLVDVAKQPDV